MEPDAECHIGGVGKESGDAVLDEERRGVKPRWLKRLKREN